MSKQIPRKPSPNTRPPSPRIPVKHTARGTIPVSRHRKSPSLFEPNSSSSERISSQNQNTSGASSAYQNVRPKAIKNLGMLDNKDLLSQSAYFDEADSEIQSIYERVVMDRSIQHSLQEIITAQKLQVANKGQQNLSQGLPGTGTGIETGHYKNQLSSSSSSFFATSSSFKVDKDNGGVSPAGGGVGTSFDSKQQPQNISQDKSPCPSIRASLDEDQKSDNTTAAGYMTVEKLEDSSLSFANFVYPQAETMSNDTLAALLEFAQRETLMRRERDAAGSLDQDNSNPQQRVKPRKFSGTNQKHANKVPLESVLEGTPSKSNTPTPCSNTPTLSNSSTPSNSTPTGNRRPRSKSGGSESGVMGRENEYTGSSRSPSGPDEGGMHNYKSSHKGVNNSYDNYENRDTGSDSGRVRPVEKMLGISPFYVRKYSPTTTGGGTGGTVHRQGQGVHQNSAKSTTSSNSRLSPWLVFDPPHGTQTRMSPTRTVSSTPPIFMNNNNHTHSSSQGGPIRLTAKKFTSAPMTFFSPEEREQFGREGFSPGRAGDDDDASFLSVASSYQSREVEVTDPVGCESSSGSGGGGSQQQFLSSPWTAFDDISVSSSEASSSRGGGKGGYRMRSPRVPVSTGGVKKDLYRNDKLKC
mmetsp:Transcript_28665/g.27467  ORF Transcript_28665/g.27467 Transcript_28665/m.27467 type:complete len:638 (+) Transcript_28665:252-2165(+)|eukprot:CAMPEP_0119035846 /NCGR_PEP_ID=MMETSP1177-20130426/3096_1 /TAXON_ID=2985 /ORGANISM="Ochromonas sp, Strain CCMP1899" /LENGTH=637 /DNA_ID=CAMNT_0006994681 /DNA_START=204 /DNA_END=2117 /DNA_ORIENTATION=+